jgi:hypothetical protein
MGFEGVAKDEDTSFARRPFSLAKIFAAHFECLPTKRTVSRNRVLNAQSINCLCVNTDDLSFFVYGSNDAIRPDKHCPERCACRI